MKIKVLSIAALIGVLLFLVTLITFLAMGFFLPHLLVTLEFAATIRPFALSASLYVGLSLLLAHSANRLRTSKPFSRRRFFKDINKEKRTLLILAFASAFIGYLMYVMVIKIPADFLHKNAPKETVQFNARATSAWPARKELRKDCRYHLLFDAPKISSDIQYVCINGNQWLGLRNAQYPITITLYGKKSPYGYELRYKE